MSVKKSGQPFGQHFDAGMQNAVTDAQFLTDKQNVIRGDTQALQYTPGLNIAAIRVGGGRAICHIDAAYASACLSLPLKLKENAEFIVLMGKQKKRNRGARISTHRNQEN
jgi:hypothetical protein